MGFTYIKTGLFILIPVLLYLIHKKMYYWCHACSQPFRIDMTSNEMKCTLCGSEFVEIIRDNSSNIFNSFLGNFMRPRRLAPLAVPLSYPEDTQSSYTVRTSYTGPGQRTVTRVYNYSPEGSATDNQIPGMEFLDSDDGLFRGFLNELSEGMPRDRRNMIFPFAQNIRRLLENLITRRDMQSPTPSSFLNQMNGKTVTSEMFKKLENKSCVICLEIFKEKEEIYELKCKHIYHLDCLKKWLEKSRFCPVCRESAVETEPNEDNTISSDDIASD